MSSLMRRMRSAALASLLLTSGCTDGKSRDALSERFPGTPFSMLDDVTLGMSASSLHEARPRISFSPYSGFLEKTDGGAFAYGFPTGRIWENDFDQGAPLQWVSHATGAASPAEARQFWIRAVHQAIGGMGEPARCEAIKGRSPGARAVWNSGGAWLEIAVRASLETGGDTLPDRVLVTASTGDDPARPSDLVTTDCASLLADTAGREA